MIHTYDGWPFAEVAARLNSPLLQCVPLVGSTLDVVHRLAAEGAPSTTAVLADQQTKGRGRQGRRWESPAGVGIWLGFLFRPLRAPVTGVLSLRVGMTVAESLGELGARARVKWPNDVLLADRKVAGILCESREQRCETWVAVGIGMNVHGPLPSAVRDAAVALDSVLPSITRLAVLERLLPALERLDIAETLSDLERRVFADLDWLCGRALLEPARGTACGIAADGALLIDTGEGIRRVTAGTVIAA